MATRTETLIPSLPGARLLRDVTAKLVSALTIIHEAFVEAQEQARVAEERHRLIGE